MACPKCKGYNIKISLLKRQLKELQKSNPQEDKKKMERIYWIIKGR